MLENGTLVDGKYRVLHEIGHGGMSVVYLALNERANKTWAIKEVRKNGSTSFEVVRQGLIAETNILKKLNHPHLPSIIDVIDQDDSFLVVMDYVEGVSLAKLLKTSGAQPWKDVVEWGKQLCDVLAYLHSRKPPIIYRDMKPDNVQLKPDGTITLLDFGTAREYKYRGAEGSDTSCLGTRGYAAPEQYGGMGETDARTDIYCLGATMYHLLTGHNPSLPPYEMKPIRQINPALPVGLENIILRCTQQDPALRYQNCTELMYDLENIDKVTWEHIKTLKKKIRLFAVCAALTVVFGLTAATTKVMAGRQSDEQYDRYIAQGTQASNGVESPGDMEYQAGEQNFKAAIKLKPKKKDAYLALARLYVKDGGDVFAISSEEEASMRNLISANKIDEDMDEYAEIAFNWGSYIYFYYRDSTTEGTGRGSPKLARTYLEAAGGAKPLQLSDSESNGNARKELAAAMCRISRGEDLLNIKGRNIVDAGDGEEYSYFSYWDDLNVLISPELMDQVIGSTNSTTYLLSLYRTVANSLYENMVDFNKSQSEVGQMAAQIEANCSVLVSADYNAFVPGSEETIILDYINNQLNAIIEKSKTLRTESN